MKTHPLSAQTDIFPLVDLLEMTVPLGEEAELPLVESQGAAATAAADERRQQEPPLLTPAPTPPPPPPPLPPPPPASFLLPPAAPFPPSALHSRDEGNAAMRSGDFAAAVVSYSRTLLSLLESEREGGERETHRLARALVLSNRGAARLSLGRFSKAAADSLQAIKLCPYWWRPWERLARARAGAGDARGGVRACREGSEAAAIASAAATKGLPSLPTRERVEAQAALRREADAITLEAAHEGRFDGFDGAVLEVSREERKSFPPLSTSGKEKKNRRKKKKEKKIKRKKVRPAESGSEWLGLPAPPREDESDDDDYDDGASQRRICSSSGSSGGGNGNGNGNGNALALAALRPPSSSPAPSRERRRRRQTSFRSLHDALAAAEDGDVIRMLPGTHNSLGRSAVIDKRVLIDGRESAKGSGGVFAGGGGFSPPFLSTAAGATLDARGNVPALRFRRPAAVVGLVIDATGFREAVRVDSLRAGDSGNRSKNGAPRALLAGCSVASSGDDAAVAAGRSASLTLLGCEVTGANRAGVRAFAGGDVELRWCSIERCGTHGLAAQALSPSSPFLAAGPAARPRRLELGGRVSARECRVSACREEGALCSGRGSRLVLEGVRIDRCSGPAVDASGAGCSVLLRGGGNELAGCSGGGLWLWQGARARVSGGGGNAISCEETFALLTDGKGTGLEIDGGCCEVRGGASGAEAEKAAAAAAVGIDAGDGSDQENGNGSGNGAVAEQQQQLQRRHCGPPPEVGPFRWDGPDPLRAE